MTSASWALSTPQDVLPPSPYSGLSSDTADVDIVERESAWPQALVAPGCVC